MKWKLNDIVVENSIEEFAKRMVLVSIEDIEKLNEHGIKYNTFSDAVRKTKFIRQGKKHKRSNAEDIKVILEDLKSMSIRSIARKYKCSTSTIQYTKKGVY
jgi:hypothetical protein